MCGLVGIIDLKGSRDIDQELLRSMNDLQYHRGPDEAGVHFEPGVGLGHRRLSIIDLASGQQPLYNEDKSVVVVYNGEIYNFQELAVELSKLGHSFRTHCDTEVIVHAWEQWGEHCVERFRGMFAFAIWDRNKKTLFLARDRLGVKPLYYAVLDSGYIVFASELKSILKHPEFQRQLSPLAIEEYFAYGYVPDPKTIFSTASKLAPGHTITITKAENRIQQKMYWDPPFSPQVRGSEEELVEQLMAHMNEAIKIRLVSEVPLGAFLSGGVDSSAVVAIMAGLQPDSPVNTCAIGFSDPKYDESDYALKVAQRYNTNHYMEEATSDDYNLLDKLVDLYDEPFADSSALPTYRVCALAKKQVTVALSGDGGDENFAGYRRYRWHMYEERARGFFPDPIRLPIFGFLGRFYPKLDWAPRYVRGKSTFQSLARDTVEGYYHGVSIVHDKMRKQLFSTDFSKSLDGYQAVQVLKNYASSAPTKHPLSLVQYLDMKSYLPGDIMTKVDRASMAHSLEVREPLLDHKLVEWVSGLSPDVKLKGAESKYILKKAMEPLLPHDIMYRRKMGFSVPLASWLRGPLRERVKEAINGNTLRDSGIFDSRYLSRMLEEHLSGMGEHSSALWSVLMFESFLRKNAEHS